MDALTPSSPLGDPFAITTLEQLAQHYDAPRELVLKKVTHRLEERTRAFIAASPFAILATCGSNGPHATPRGDAPGFILPLDEGTLALPDRRGNNRLDGLRDIVENPEVALLFFVPGIGETLRVNGTARITADLALRERFTEQGKTPATVLLISVREVYMQCAKALMRSRLWGERKRPEAVPTMGQLIAAHTGGLVEPESYDRDAPQRLRDTMY
ncbi:pyridoxamine 5'-phosphate oxidase family protein [Siccirubricoccus sp. KC 17139]|uniref:Pyridoxamine 5'-phosphate oxidase family protein n=1 Tax=Siccirubricoccus soli TaxID=2899147 RepID=A0ABT1DCI8_9PROT|nr:pyridoxamine 5'-phosphate oxidase family protein [Siccirubricoccus soli]MCO6419658.1 pyridoxamine 5'-phosphate oxidase family protein [Siccirubricoccus soli]MCP2685793.1 pyridoxamine 5'-phosphate oxidase family protein [Siccirubricoccus soli]